MKEQFSELLSKLRKQARLTNIQLAELADVSRSLIPGLQSGKRRIGEYQARKLGAALGLTGKVLEDFVYAAINTCTEKVLEESKAYPAELLNVAAKQLRMAGIEPHQVHQCIISEDKQESHVSIMLRDGTKAQLETKIALAA